MTRKLLQRFSARIAAALLAGTALTAPAFANVKAQTLDAETVNKIRLFTEILDAIQNRYVEGVDDAELMENALNGILQKLDPHSRYVGPETFTEQNKARRREYGGLGIEVTLENKVVKVGFVTEDSPAEKAGLKAGDYITAVSGKSVFGKSLDDAVKDMRGPIGEAVDVTVQSPDGTVKTLSIKRDTVVGRVVRHRMEDGFGYVQLITFNNPKVAADTEKAIKALISDNGGPLPGLVIDLRGNRGGLVSETIKVASLLLDGGEVMSIRSRDLSQTERKNANEGQLLKGTPVIVLINSLSASASEIIAGAVKDRGRGIVMGMTSFGKGSVQSVIPLDKGKKGALRLTTARYYTPSGLSIQGTGIVPDIAVYHRPDDGKERRRFSEANFDNAISNTTQERATAEEAQDIDYPPEGWPRTEDYQLKKAIDLLKSGQYSQTLSASLAQRDPLSTPPRKTP